MWNLCFDELLEALHRGPATCVGYADDGLLLVSGPDPSALADTIRPLLQKAVEWGRKYGLRFSPEKTKAMLFTRKRKYSTPRLEFQGVDLEFMDEIKYLGITVNRKLTWTGHLKAKIQQCKWQMQRIKAAVGTRWGPNPKQMLWIHSAFVVPKLTYGAHVWGGVVRRGNWEGLRRLNRGFFHGLGPMRRGTPTATLEILADRPPLELTIQKTAALTQYRIATEVVTTWDGRGLKELGHRSI